MRIKLSPSAVHSDAALASILCAGKFKVGYFLDSLRTDGSPRKIYTYFKRYLYIIIIHYFGTLCISVGTNKCLQNCYINLLTPIGFSQFHKVYNSKILHGARFVLMVLDRYQNRQRLFLCTALTYWFL
jgi:hypothetical protein